MIHCENVCKTYQKNGAESAAVLHDINLTVPEGEFCCVLGPSGCGKTTLLNLIAGFIEPTRGRITFNGSRVLSPGPDRGVVFQDANLFPWLTVLENVMFGLRQREMTREKRFTAALHYLETVGMAGHTDAYPHTLSGGMRQRVSIARVLALEPRALLMDEPFSNLDTNARERLQDELLRIWEAQRRTVVYVTHSVEEAVYLADRVIVMGTAIKNICKEMVMPLERPRDRSSAAFQRTTAQLRNELAVLPCCIQTAAERRIFPA
jgi:NitT/TauT family transport system ATP-binding protein